MEFAGYKFDNKYLVEKWDDIKKFLTDDQLENLYDILKAINIGRESEGKNKNNSYLVVNIDEPYSKEIAEILYKNIDEIKKV